MPHSAVYHTPPQKKGLLARLREEAEMRKLREGTIRQYSGWARKLYLFHKRRPLRELQVDDLRGFLAAEAARDAAASTMNQARAAILFVYRRVLKMSVRGLLKLPRAKRPKLVRVALSRPEVDRLFAAMRGTHRLMAELLYGSGLRLMECVQLRVKDIEFETRRILVCDGKGAKWRYVPLSYSVREELTTHLNLRQAQWQCDCAAGIVAGMPDGLLSKKYPNAAREFAWQYVFASAAVRDGRRWHCGETGLQKAVKAGLGKAQVFKKASCHSLRHSFCTDLLRMDPRVDVRTVSRMMGHKDVRTTMDYVESLDASECPSPADSDNIVHFPSLVYGDDPRRAVAV